jgi:hypothetical protein
MAGMMALLMPIVFGLIVPNWWFTTLGRDVGYGLRAARGPTPPQPGDTAMIGMWEPSVAFYQGQAAGVGGGTARESDKRLFTRPADAPLGLTANFACVTEDIWRDLPPYARAAWVIHSEHRGIAYAANAGKVIDVLVLRRRVPLHPTP